MMIGMNSVTFDVSQLSTLVFTVIGSVVMLVIHSKVSGYLKRQEAAAAERQRRQELHFKKFDAIMFSFSVILEPEKAKLFKTSFDEQMNNYYAENNFIGKDRD